jgi:hypothetical protein
MDFFMNNKQRKGENNLGDEERRMCEVWSMLECLWSVLELKTEELGCHA